MKSMIGSWRQRHCLDCHSTRWSTNQKTNSWFIMFCPRAPVRSSGIDCLWRHLRRSQDRMAGTGERRWHACQILRGGVLGEPQKRRELDHWVPHRRSETRDRLQVHRLAPQQRAEGARGGGFGWNQEILWVSSRQDEKSKWNLLRATLRTTKNVALRVAAGKAAPCNTALRVGSLADTRNCAQSLPRHRSRQRSTKVTTSLKVSNFFLHIFVFRFILFCLVVAVFVFRFVFLLLLFSVLFCFVLAVVFVYHVSNSEFGERSARSKVSQCAWDARVGFRVSALWWPNLILSAQY